MRLDHSIDSTITVTNLLYPEKDYNLMKLLYIGFWLSCSTTYSFTTGSRTLCI